MLVLQGKNWDSFTSITNILLQSIPMKQQSLKQELQQQFRIFYDPNAIQEIFSSLILTILAKSVLFFEVSDMFMNLLERIPAIKIHILNRLSLQSSRKVITGLWNWIEVFLVKLGYEKKRK